MKRIILLIILLSSITIQAQWTQIGQDIDGENAGDLFGWSTSLSSDGSIVAIGARDNIGNGSGPFAGHVRIYQNNSGVWEQIGEDIDGESNVDQSGYSVSLSSDGSIVAIGAITNDADSGGSDKGHVRVFQFSGGAWEQTGNDIDGEFQNDISGFSVSLSADGSIVAIGAIGSDANGADSGQVRVFQNNSSNWTQLGQDINGEAAGDEFGESVSLSADGLTVAIGSQWNDGGGDISGHVRILEFTGGNWTQIGEDIDGEAEGDRSGRSISLSSDGTIVAIGATGHLVEPNNGHGYVRVFQNIGGSWTQIGEDIEGDFANNLLGQVVSLSGDGSIVAFSAGQSNGSPPWNHVRVYKINNGNWSQIDEDITGETDSSKFGVNGLSLNTDGSVLAVGDILNDGSANNAGNVRVYEGNILSVSENSNFKISLYPNPTKGLVNLKFINSNTPQVLIYDITGKMVFEKQFSMINDQSQIDLSNFENGIYLIKIQDGDQQFTTKILKE